MERRVFKEALPPTYRIAYIIVAVLCVLCAWLKLMALAIPTAVLLLLITDKLIRGEYILESQVIIMRRGRFLRDKAVLITSIESVSKVSGTRRMLGNVSLTAGGRRLTINPENPDSFVECLTRRMDGLRTEERHRRTNDDETTFIRQDHEI